MIRGKTKLWMAILALAGTVLFSAPARADIGFAFDLTTLTFDYTVTNPGAGVGEVIGLVSIVDATGSKLKLQKFDLGADGLFEGEGADADTLLDLARINSSSQFDVAFDAEVVRMGTNQYTIRSTSFGVTDSVSTLASPSLSGDFTSDLVAITPGAFLFAGDLGPSVGNDSYLLPGPGPSWIFQGIPGDTAASPNEDGLLGQVSLPSGRSAFTEGRFGEFHLTGAGMMSPDSFFSSSRDSLSADIKLNLVPEPASLTLLAGGLLLLRRRQG